jgi:hypothetical protein
MGSTLLLLLAVFGVFAASATNKKEDRDGYFHTMDTVSVVDYEPVTVFDGLLPLPEWAVWVCEAFGHRLPPRTPKAAHHDAPVSTRAPLHLPRRFHKVNRDLERGGAADSDQGVMVVGEWLVMVGKSHRDDFVAVLEDRGDHTLAWPKRGPDFVSLLETLISAKIADAMTKTSFNQRKEVFGLGLANIVTGRAPSCRMPFLMSHRNWPQALWAVSLPLLPWPVLLSTSILVCM